MTLPYDLVAGEYYDANHRTSRNFDQTSQIALHAMRGRVPETGLVLEVGAGRGRSGEYLGIASERIIQLDSSQKMLALQPREPCLIRVVHTAESLPFLDAEFSCVTAFLCDPFLGLNFLSEVSRVLQPGGVFIGTTPAYEWGRPLRTNQDINASVARFLTINGAVLVPSNLVPRAQLIDMLKLAGFAAPNVNVDAHRLPRTAMAVSPDITTPAGVVGCDVYELNILYSIIATK